MALMPSWAVREYLDCGMEVGPSRGWMSLALRIDASITRNEGVDETALFQLEYKLWICI